MSRFGNPFEVRRPDALSLERIDVGSAPVPVVVYGYKWFLRRRPGWLPLDYLDQAKRLIAKDKRCLARAAEIFGQVGK